MMSSLFIGATGLKSHAEGMSVVTNNLSNVNTVGFKQAMMQYMDLTSRFQTTDSNSLTNMSQVGMGSAPGSIRTLFTSGGYEKGSSATDLSITGGGFFGVQKDGETHYTRAGNFRFTKNGALLDPNGWNLLGHAITNGKESSAITPIQMDLGPDGRGTMAGKATTSLTACSQLGGVTDANADPANPFFSMASSWNGTASPPLATGRYSYKESIQLYDAEGNTRNAAIYYDLAGTDNGRKAMEYVVALDPSEDGSALSGTAGAGLLMAGTLTFSSSGQLGNVTAFTPPASGNPSDLSAWQPASLVNGSPAFTAAFAGQAPQTIGLNMGLTLSGSTSAGLASAADAAANPGAIYSASASAKLQSKASTAYGSSCSSLVQQNDGYPEGSLRELQVTTDGTIIGTYSNGQKDELYRISLYRFTSQDGLRREGNNHYSATPESGAAEEGRPGTENFGAIQEYSLEASNVDYAREFSTMVVTQRGFQMNSKVVTTSDAMLQKALELKR